MSALDNVNATQFPDVGTTVMLTGHGYSPRIFGVPLEVHEVHEDGISVSGSRRSPYQRYHVYHGDYRPWAFPETR